ncbi:MAG: hypothetical protein N2117_15475 [Anaerolineales bacterium]|nr:hypothetical protein [Anaerolineales bacterium]MCX7756627.1 hypothetical protein [Anaerolineales bacterium]MDW8278807.1 hypothetical protein [Anaerolineales bacterium]
MKAIILLFSAAGALILIGILGFIRARYMADGSVRLLPLLLGGGGALLAAFALLLVAFQGYQVFPRGGGNGLESEPTSDQSVIQKPAALPAMCVVPTPTKPPKDIKTHDLYTCTVMFPQTLQVNSYCLNPVTKLGGATVVLPQGTSTYVNLPPNCSAVVEEEKLYSKKVACYGPVGSKVTITVQDYCTPPDANLPVKVEPSCPPDFKLNYDGVCEYVVVSNAPFCPTGTVFSSAYNCCLDVKALNLSPCPKGYDISLNRDGGGFICQRRSAFLDTTATQSYKITLGTCGPNNKNDAKPNTDDNAQPGCVIDPATGACP